jgi:excisionase family DNA binding protein
MASGARVPPDAAERLLTPAEVVAAFRVDPKTVTRWAKAGKLSSVRTLGGHRRYREAEVLGAAHRAGGRAARRMMPGGLPGSPAAGGRIIFRNYP